jgi:hypothetical protein
MKRMVFSALLILVISSAASARKFVASGSTYSLLGNYKIELADNLFTIKGKELKTFVITYENSNMEVTIAFDKKRQGMTYYVLSPALSIKYVCNGDYFGVSKLAEKELDGYGTSDASLNRSEYFHQKVITRGGNCDLENSKLIAAYFPMLLNNSENIIVAR